MNEAIRQTADIELRVEKVASLFDAFDPFPIPSRDLAKGAEEFIVGWARELPHQATFRIILHVPKDEGRHDDAASVQNAFSRHFKYLAERMSGDLHELFRAGRLSLAIGLGVLAICTVASRLAAAFLNEGYLVRFLVEGFIILGWVANWRPIEIFLYDWWPIRQRRKLYLRLAAAPVELRPS